MADDPISPSSPESPSESSTGGTTSSVEESANPLVNGTPAPAAQPSAQTPAKKADAAPGPRDTVREGVETVVFVVVLVLLLKTFIAEAFVIPTGSMASTLWGYQKVVTCPQCGHTFPVNCSSETDPQSEQRRTLVEGCTCPNCHEHIDFSYAVEGALEAMDPNSIVLGGGRDQVVAEVREVHRPRELLTLPIGGPYQITSNTKFFLDGKPESSPARIRPGMLVRVVVSLEGINRGPDRSPAISVEASSSGPIVPQVPSYNPPANSGDRVLVAKFLYDSGLRAPHRHDVVVFKFPDTPQKNYTALNYIKRLIGLPRETIGIHAGKLYVSDKLTYPEPVGLTPEQVRRAVDARAVEDAARSLDENDERARQLQAYARQFDEALKNARKQLEHDVTTPADKKQAFTIIRKSPDVLLALSRLVYDNDHQAQDLIKQGLQPRWSAETAKPAGAKADRAEGAAAAPWQPDNPSEPKVFTAKADGDQPAWLHYRHLVPSDDRKTVNASLITDVMGYNSGRPLRQQAANWASDLTLEATVQVETPAGEVWLEVSKGIDRFQARFNLQSGDCTLVRLQTLDGQEKKTDLATKPTAMKTAGTYHVRLANVDERLTLWVNDVMPFGDGQEYDPAPVPGPTEENDLKRPAGIAAKGASVKVEHLKVWRDTYYTSEGSGPDVNLSASEWSDPKAWKPLRENDRYKLMYVQPGHYLCLGDNSPESSDGRYWGLVPDRLMLGRALIVYYPFKFPYWPLNNPENRVGAIH